MSRPTIEACPRFDVRELVSDLRGGRRGHRELPADAVVGARRRFLFQGAELVAVEVLLELDGRRRRGSLRLREADPDRRPTESRLEALPAALGGLRWRLRCPECDRPGYLIHRGPPGWGCRRCAGLVYASTRQTPLQRLAAAERAAREAIGDHGDHGDPIRPVRPPGVRRDTFEELVRAARAAHSAHRQALVISAG